MKIALLILLGFCLSLFPKNEPKLLLRFDDIGMSHAVNMGIKEIVDLDIPFSASIMFACPWYQEGVDILKDETQVTLGIHLTLNSEWKNYRWGPVAGKDAVPSLVDEHGFFFPSRATLYENNPTLTDIETELRAQIERAMKSGANIQYVDYHMGTAVDKPEYRAIVEKLAVEYNLAISRYFGEVDVNSMYFAPIPSKKDTLFATLNNLKSDQYNLFVTHVGKDSPELAAMIDLNPFGPEFMSKHRSAELDAFTSPEFLQLIRENNIQLLNYSDIINTHGLKAMESPINSGYMIYEK
ncbi:MAG: ChbG/HpnK family deacetylase [Balneolaceae bacterium]